MDGEQGCRRGIQGMVAVYSALAYQQTYKVQLDWVLVKHLERKKMKS